MGSSEHRIGDVQRARKAEEASRQQLAELNWSEAKVKDVERELRARQRELTGPDGLPGSE